MTYEVAPVRTSWRDSALTRVLGSAASWFLFSLCFTLFTLVTFVVMGLGGSCASGGAYEIAVECPEAVAAFMPLSIFGGLFAVAIGLFLAQGFGTPLVSWAWPILFIGLGLAFVLSMDTTGYIMGGVFILMGIVPLAIEVRGSVQRVLIGINSPSGVRYSEPAGAKRSVMATGQPNPEGAVRPTILSWLLSLGITAVTIWLGYTVARLWFASVGTPAE